MTAFLLGIVNFVFVVPAYCLAQQSYSYAVYVCLVVQMIYTATTRGRTIYYGLEKQFEDLGWLGHTFSETKRTKEVSDWPHPIAVHHGVCIWLPCCRCGATFDANHAGVAVNALTPVEERHFADATKGWHPLAAILMTTSSVQPLCFCWAFLANWWALRTLQLPTREEELPKETWSIVRNLKDTIDTFSLLLLADIVNGMSQQIIAELGRLAKVCSHHPPITYWKPAPRSGSGCPSSL